MWHSFFESVTSFVPIFRCIFAYRMSITLTNTYITTKFPFYLFWHVICSIFKYCDTVFSNQQPPLFLFSIAYLHTECSITITNTYISTKIPFYLFWHIICSIFKYCDTVFSNQQPPLFLFFTWMLIYEINICDELFSWH